MTRINVVPVNTVMHDYTPTAEAVAINQKRIEERLS